MFPSASCSSESSWIQLLLYFPVWGLWLIKIRREGSVWSVLLLNVHGQQTKHTYVYTALSSLWGSSRGFLSASRVTFYFKRSCIKSSRQFLVFCLLNKGNQCQRGSFGPLFHGPEEKHDQKSSCSFKGGFVWGVGKASSLVWLHQRSAGRGLSGKRLSLRHPDLEMSGGLPSRDVQCATDHIPKEFC